MQLKCIDKTVFEGYRDNVLVREDRQVVFELVGNSNFKRNGDSRTFFGFTGNEPGPEKYTLMSLNATDFTYYKVGQFYTLALIQEVRG